MQWSSLKKTCSHCNSNNHCFFCTLCFTYCKCLSCSEHVFTSKCPCNKDLIWSDQDNLFCGKCSNSRAGYVCFDCGFKLCVDCYNNTPEVSDKNSNNVNSNSTNSKKNSINANQGKDQDKDKDKANININTIPDDLFDTDNNNNNFIDKNMYYYINNQNLVHNKSVNHEILDFIDNCYEGPVRSSLKSNKNPENQVNQNVQPQINNFPEEDELIQIQDISMRTTTQEHHINNPNNELNEKPEEPIFPHIISIGFDKKINLIDLNQPSIIKMQSTENKVEFIIRMDKTNIATVESFSKEIKFWVLPGLKNYLTITDKDFVHGILSIDDKRLVTCSDNKLKLWHVEAEESQLFLSSHSNKVRSLLKLNSNQIASGSFDSTIKIWSVPTLSCLLTITGHENNVNCLVKVNSQQMASGSFDKTIKIWNVKDGSCAQNIVGHSDNIRTMICTGSDRLVSGSDDMSIKVWNIMNGLCLRTIKGHENKISGLIRLSGKYIVSCSWDCSVRVWNTETGKGVKKFTAHENYVFGMLLAE